MSFEIRGDAQCELISRIKILVFSYRRPVGRLALDISNVAAYEATDLQPLTPQLRLIRVFPSLTPASAEVVSSVASIWGSDLFTTAAGRMLVLTIATHGPVQAAKVIASGLVKGEISERWAETADAFGVVIASHPDVFQRAPEGILRRVAGDDDVSRLGVRVNGREWDLIY